MKIQFTNGQLRWHLENNILGLNENAVKGIIRTCNKFNNGQLQLHSEIAPGAKVSVSEMLEDLKIEIG